MSIPPNPPPNPASGASPPATAASCVVVIPAEPAATVHISAAPTEARPHVAIEPAPAPAPSFINLVLRVNGNDYGFDRKKLTAAEDARFLEIIDDLGGNDPSFDLNLTELISHTNNGATSNFHESKDEMAELRTLVEKALGVDFFAWQSRLCDQRGCQTNQPLFLCAGKVLTDLKVEDRDRFKALSAKNLQTEAPLSMKEKKEILKRLSASKNLTEQTIAMLREIQEEIKASPPPNRLLLESQKSSLEKTLARFTPKTTQGILSDPNGISLSEHNSTSLKVGAIQLEALYPLELDQTYDENKAALGRKEKEIGEIIASRKEFEPIVWGEITHPGKLLGLKPNDTEFAEQQQAFAKDVSLAGIETAEDFETYGNKSTIGPELFFIQLQALIAKEGTTTAQIEAYVNESSYFQVAFNSLHPHLLERAREKMVAIAEKLRKVNAEIEQNLPPILATASPETICTTFDQVYNRLLAAA